MELYFDYIDGNITSEGVFDTPPDFNPLLIYCRCGFSNSNYTVEAVSLFASSGCGRP
jgi:hypothetical protein